MENQYDIFISYSRKDYNEVHKIVDILNNKGYNVWFDVDGIESGGEFINKIVTAIDNSDSLIFMCTDHSVAGEWTQKEVKYAKDTNKAVIPLLLNGKMPERGWFRFLYGNIDCIDYTNNIQRDKLFRDLDKKYKSKSNNTDSTYDVKKGKNKNNVGFKVVNNIIVLDIVGDFHIQLEKDLKNNIFIGNIPVKEILNSINDYNSGSITPIKPNMVAAGTLATGTLVTPLGILSSPLVSAAIAVGAVKLKEDFNDKGKTKIGDIITLSSNMFKKRNLKKIESDAFDEILAVINKKYNITLEKVTDSIRENTDINLTPFAVYLDLSKLKYARQSLENKLKNLIK